MYLSFLVTMLPYQNSLKNLNISLVGKISERGKTALNWTQNQWVVLRRRKKIFRWRPMESRNKRLYLKLFNLCPNLSLMLQDELLIRWYRLRPWKYPEYLRIEFGITLRIRYLLSPLQELGINQMLIKE